MLPHNLLLFDSTQAESVYEFQDSDAQAVADAASTSFDNTHAEALDDFIAGLKTDSLWTIIGGAHLLAAQAADHALINIKNPGTADLTEVNSPTFTADSGYSGDASTSYLTNSVALSSLTGVSQNDASFGGYAITAVPSNRVIGFSDGTSGNGHDPLIRNVSSGTAARLALNTGATSDDISHSTWTGLFHISRDNSADYDFYHEGSSIGTATETSAAIGAALFTVLRSHTLYTDGRVAFVFYGGSMNATQAGNLSTRLDTYLTAIGAIS